MTPADVVADLARIYRCRGCGAWRWVPDDLTSCPTCRDIHFSSRNESA
jgi:hypothetical protein